MDDKQLLDDLMNLLEEVDKPSPSDDLVSRLESKVLDHYDHPKFVRIQLRTVLSLAASFLLLMMINIYALNTTTQEVTYAEQQSDNTYDLLAIQTLYDE